MPKAGAFSGDVRELVDEGLVASDRLIDYQTVRIDDRLKGIDDPLFLTSLRPARLFNGAALWPNSRQHRLEPIDPNARRKVRLDLDQVDIVMLRITGDLEIAVVHGAGVTIDLADIQNAIKCLDDAPSGFVYSSAGWIDETN